jgi:sugar lactone lactonase YvrE
VRRLALLLFALACAAATAGVAAAPPRFVDPEGVALDGRGNLLVTDLHGKRVFRVSVGRKTKSVLASTATAAIDVAVARDGTVYVLGEQRLYRLDGSSLTQLAVDIPLTFAIAPAPDGRLALADIGASTIQLLDPATGTLTRVDVKVSRAHGVAFRSDGSLIVADTDAGRVLGVAGGNVRVLARLRSPLSVAVGRDNSVYVVLVDLGQVVRLFPNGKRRTIVRGLSDPADVAVDAQGRVFVSEHDAGRVVVRGLGGKLRTLAR